MKKSYLIATIAATVLVTGVMAQGYYGHQRGNHYNMQKHMNGDGYRMNNGYHMNNRHNMYNYNYENSGNSERMGNFQNYDMSNRAGYNLGFLNGVNLTNEQVYQISIIRDEMKLELRKAGKNIVGTNSGKYFTEKSFDKKAMVSDRKNIPSDMVEIKANYMEKMYNILTSDQKKIVFENSKNIENF